MPLFPPMSAPEPQDFSLPQKWRMPVCSITRRSGGLRLLAFECSEQRKRRRARGLAAHRRTHLPKRVLLYRRSSSLASGTSLAFWRYSTPLAMSIGTPRPLQYIFPKR